MSAEMFAAWIALIALSATELRLIVNHRQHEKRTGNKLAIFKLCQKSSLTEREIIDKLKTDGVNISANELRKTLYEMLSDETLVFLGDTQAYETRSHFSKHHIQEKQPA
jgi:hypothetical protein